MLQIRDAQIRAFSEALMAQFVEHMVIHLRTTFPKEIAHHGLEEPDLEPLVVIGIEQAQNHGIVNEDDVRLFLEYQLMLKPSFDTDPQYSWAGRILERDSLTGYEKMQQIHEHWVFLRAGQ